MKMSACKRLLGNIEDMRDCFDTTLSGSKPQLWKICKIFVLPFPFLHFRKEVIHQLWGPLRVCPHAQGYPLSLWVVLQKPPCLASLSALCAHEQEWQPVPQWTQELWAARDLLAKERVWRLSAQPAHPSRTPWEWVVKSIV